MLLLYDCINTIVFVVLAYIFIGLFFTSRAKNKSRHMILLVIWILAELIIVNLLSDVFIIKALFTVLLTAIVSCLRYDGHPFKIGVLALIEYGLYASFELLIYFVIVKCYSYIYIYDLDDSVMSIYCGTISEILFIITILVIHAIIKRDTFTHIDAVELLKFSVFPIITISLILVIGYYSFGRSLQTAELKIYTYLAIILLASNVYMYWLLRIDIDNKLLQEKNHLFEVYASDLVALYDEIKEEHKLIAGIEHEYNNHLLVIDRLIAAGKTDEAEKYLSEQRFSQAGKDVINTGNDVISALFNAKYAEALRKGIRVRFDIDNLSGIEIKDTDIVIILSNLFNNAIEACEKCDKDKTISIKIMPLDKLLYISVSNTCINNDGTDMELLSTSKEDKRRHGFGLKNIRSIVESYDGQMDVIAEATRFTVRIVIPYPRIVYPVPAKSIHAALQDPDNVY